jgi:hypothetical protein
MTNGMKSMTLATVLALMTIGMGSTVSAADRQRSCANPGDCGGSFRLHESLRSNSGVEGPRRLRTDSRARDNDAGRALDTKKNSSFRKRRLITDGNSGQLDSKSREVIRKKRMKTEDQDRSRPQARKLKRNQHAHSGWKYDRKKHKRRKHRNRWFPYYYGGFYYPERYWLVDRDPYYSVDPSRVSCGEGRDIVRENGYGSVRTVECVGTTYTYLGRRSGETYRITVNAQTGNIISRKRA